MLLLDGNRMVVESQTLHVWNSYTIVTYIYPIVDPNLEQPLCAIQMPCQTNMLSGAAVPKKCNTSLS